MCLPLTGSWDGAGDRRHEPAALTKPRAEMGGCLVMIKPRKSEMVILVFEYWLTELLAVPSLVMRVHHEE